ncbi:hypothetical protein CEXT_628751 [Caerostris extrusa]|uniref:Uncharacterized protein n=1 Tax=Caerostris extrusa TaxID=172846 RepID=A0AAV4U6U0_CAEEX|nr:hypothetical protein CEXT_628751 [Caerostris extrusa]
MEEKCYCIKEMDFWCLLPFNQSGLRTIISKGVIISRNRTSEPTPPPPRVPTFLEPNEGTLQSKHLSTPFPT